MAIKQSGEGSSFRNSSTNMPQPKFYKIILSPHECSRLGIPEHFASRYCKNMQNPAYVVVPSGEVWEVEVVHSEGQIWLTEGWQDFTDYYSIDSGYFLMFGYDGFSQFNVIIFDLSASEIEYPYNAVHGTRHAPKKNQIELDDSIEILEDIPQSHRGAKVADIIDLSAVKIGQCPLGQCSKRKREEDSEDDVSVDMQDVHSLSFRRKGRKTSESCRKHTQKSKIIHDNNNAAMDKERSIAYQRAKAFKSNNPFIIFFMQPSYVLSPFNLSVSLKFAMKYFLENRGDLVLRVPGKGSWSVKCNFGTANAKISWKAFVDDNKLKVGDVCVFEVIKGTKLVDVTIFPAAGSTPMNKIGGQEVPGVSDSKNKIIKTDKPVPCCQPNMVLTKKLKQQRGGSYGFNSNIKEEHGEGTEIGHSIEILGHRPSGKSSKKKRLEGEAEVDASIDVHTKSIKVEESQEDVASPSFTRNTKKSGESSRMHLQQSKIVSGKNKKVMDKERTIAYQRAKAFKSNNPFIVSFMQPSYVSKKYILSIGLTFAKKYFRKNCSNLTLRVPGRGSWSVKCCLRTSDTQILSGWKEFVLDNKLKSGDVCVFEVIKCTELSIDVTIFRAAGRTLLHKTDGEVPEVSVGKKPRIQKLFTAENGKLRSHRKEIQMVSLQKLKVNEWLTIMCIQELGECTNSSPMGRVVAQDMVLAYQRAEAFSSENPFFICFMQPSYVSLARGQIQLSITLSRARKFFPTKHSDLVLQVSSKRTWAVKCNLGTQNAKLSSGWKEFVLDNNIKVGDVCVFELVNRSKLLFNVIIFPAGEGV